MSSLPPDPLQAAAPADLALPQSAPGGVEDLPWWPRADLPRALEGLSGRGAPALGPLPAEDGMIADWTDWAASRLQIRLDRASCLRAELPARIMHLRRGILWHPRGHSFLVIRGRGPGSRLGRGLVSVLGPDGQTHRLALARLERAMLPPSHPSLLRQGLRIAACLPGATDLPQRLARLADADQPVTGLWQVQPDPQGTARAAWAARLPVLALTVLVLGLAAQGAEIALWAEIGGAALGLARPDAATTLALLFAPFLLGLLSTAAADTLVRRLGLLIRRRLLRAAVSLPDHALRGDGPEALLARGMEAQGLESALAASLLGSLTAMGQILWTLWVLAQGTLAMPLIALFLAVLTLQLALSLLYAKSARRWTAARRDLTAHMVEWMIGHRSLPSLGTDDQAMTRLAEPLYRLSGTGARMDGAALRAFALLTNGWTMMALALCAALGLLGQDWALTLGGIVLAARAIVASAGALASLGIARIARDQIGPLWTTRPDPVPPVYPDPPGTGLPLMSLHGATLAHADRKLALDADLSVLPGARLWLTGASGAGKSTLLRLLAGLTPPASGRLLGPAGQILAPRHMTRAAALVPQFHDNHVFNGSLAFNLLLGRGWPGRAEDLAQAERVARDLGLGPLIDRMPAGLATDLGDTGWQLSQGERARLFLARALLQGAPVLALDESLAALDPDTEAECLDLLDRQADALVMVRHD